MYFIADTKPWKEIVRGQSRVWVLHDVEVIKALGESIGMTFKDVSSMQNYFGKNSCQIFLRTTDIEAAISIVCSGYLEQSSASALNKSV